MLTKIQQLFLAQFRGKRLMYENAVRKFYKAASRHLGELEYKGNELDRRIVMDIKAINVHLNSINEGLKIVRSRNEHTGETCYVLKTLFKTNTECWESVEGGTNKAQCLHKITSIIVTKLTKAVSHDEILEEIRDLSFSGLAEQLAQFVKEHWLVFDEKEEMYSLGPRLTAQMEEWLSSDPAVIKCSRCTIIVLRGCFCYCRKTAVHLSCRVPDLSLRCDNCHIGIKRFRGTNYNESRAKKLKKQKESFGKRGLANLGNSCYFNSIVQCLAHLPLLESVFRKSESELIQVFSNLLLELSQSEEVVFFEPNICLEMLKEKLPEFRNNKQQDAYEFLNFLWELIIENLEPEKRSDLREKIEGKMKTSTLCHNCNKLKSKVEPFSELSLPFPEITDEYSLKTLLDSYFSPEDLESKYECQNCDIRTKASQFYRVAEQPRLLTLHLKRFSFNKKSKKIFHHVMFPLRGLTHNTLNNVTYSLSGVIAHHGRTMQSGHYTAYCYNNSDFSWYHYNDTEVIPISEENLKKVDAYMLFYKKD